ncbi:MAG: DUF5702 domain-containing protein [Lachnospiraceae bacterium]
MGRRGSVTVFFSLILSLLITLVVSCFWSAQMAAARVQIANGAEIGLYSLFAQYDSELLETYNLFYLEGGFGQGELNMGKVYDTVTSYMEPVLHQNYQNLQIESGGITGYRLATDNHGESFRQQAAAYMRETLGAQGIQLLLDKVERGSEDVQEQQNTKENALQGNSMEDYDRALSEAAESSEESEGVVEVEPGGEVQEVTPPVENPIDTIRSIKQMGILELVLADPSSVSPKTADISSLVSNRSLQQGMGIFEGQESESAATENLLFQEYILRQVGNFRRPAQSGQLEYLCEYIIGKNGSDVENLKAVANRLLLIREGINFVYLLGDAPKRAQVASMATAISSALLIPMASGIVEMVLLGCWAYGESILDVRELFAGGKIPLMKNDANWQLSLENLGQILQRMDTDRRDDAQGMDYEDYLRVLLYLEEQQTKTMKCLDAFELTVRGTQGHEQFRMDSCLDALEVSIDVNANNRKTFCVMRQYRYR